VCIDAACGDGVVTPPEECDNGTANAAGAGCETNCKWTCATGDATRDCPSSDPCVANGLCDAVKHTCAPGVPLANGSACGTQMACVGGACVAASCGDALVTPPEQCDNGSANGPGQGCESDCKFTCSNAATDCAPVACNVMSCTSAHLCQATPDATKNGQSCGGANVCSNGACLPAGSTCGNGVKEAGEDCDFGSAVNGPGVGCEANCKFSCTGGTPGSCVDMNACHNAPTCTAMTYNTQTGYKCVNGSTKSDGSACGTGAICLAGTCGASVCGDGYRDSAKNEQCDDGNTTNLDACDSTCKFEQDQRATALKIIFGTDTNCAKNAIGGSIGAAAQGTFQQTITDSVKDGSCSALFKFVSSDLSGQNAAVSVGSLSGTPTTTTGYDGTSDLDWWYQADPLTYDGSRNATATLTGNYTAGVLDATGAANLTLNVGGAVALLRVTGAHMKATVGAPTTTPTVSAANATPGHVAAEHLDPALKSYPTTGGAQTSPAGFICGNISAASLAATPVAATLLAGGSSPCTQGYTASNKMLDVFVNGCSVKAGPFTVTAIKATQPDQVDAAATPAGAGGPYTLQVDANKRVNQCKDKNGTVVTLTTCLTAAAYSSYFKFATDRVIIKQ
jgi:cysteine-rich repeat protein